jgi:hypothetical protein
MLAFGKEVSHTREELLTFVWLVVLHLAPGVLAMLAKA